MPTIRELVAALRERDGVEAAVLLGRDGLVIDAANALPAADTDAIAALVPAVVGSADALGHQSGRGALLTAILEHEGGIAVVSVLTPDAVLLVMMRESAHVGPLLFELRRSRQHLASLV
ncbi:MAG TPA: roadblock/LC7 domain-containing protein [Gemmatimonadaceae bacterium]|jgi:predicted regulator of Ras-like GTPase activity (Roadblock/LC7/MglB family)|nr:roadblock/LC7 domain-containing protein [Gemmatimonadaceae bacterium]